MKNTKLILGLIVSCVCLAGYVIPASAQQSDTWELDVHARPSTAQPGEYGEYVIWVRSLSGAESSGPVTVQLDLPSEITLTGLQTNPYWLQAQVGWSCDVALAQCTSDTTDLNGDGDANDEGEPGPVRSTRPMNPILAEYTVSPTATGPLEVEATVSGGGLATDSDQASQPVGSVEDPFGLVLGSYFADAFKEHSTEFERQAGAHPDRVTVGFDLTSVGRRGELFPGFFRNYIDATGRALRDVEVTTPRGLVGNPDAVPKCTVKELSSGAGNANCPTASQIGVIDLGLSQVGLASEHHLALYNMVPPKGALAAFGFNFSGYLAYIVATLDPTDYSIKTEVRYINETLPVLWQRATLWGVPADPSHDAERWMPSKDRPGLDRVKTTDPDQVDDGGEPNMPPLPASTPRRPFLTLPSACGIEDTTDLRVRSWANPNEWKAESTPPSTVTGCDALTFDAGLDAEPTTQEVDSPSGLDVTLSSPQNDQPDELGTPSLKRAVVTLPEGVGVNPSSADGLEACTPAEIGLGTDDPVTCPNAAKIGAGELITPVLPRPVKGSIYLAEQRANPFGSLLALYLVFEDKDRGLLVKLPGRVELDPVTGQITATFDENPQLPFSELNLRFKSDERAPLTTPATCGSYEIESELAAWSGHLNRSTSEFTVDGGPGGGPCLAGEPGEPGDPADLADRPFDPGLQSGLANAVAGSSSPFVFKLTRPDGHQELKRVEVDLPPGVTAKLAGVSKCSDATLEAISGAEGAGRGEVEAPSCPANALIGKATIGAGAGATPFYLETSKVYLAGPFDPDGAGPKKTAPVSMAIVSPAVAGPFDLGNVVTRAALYVDRDDAQVHAADAEIPQFLHGIPLRIRDVRISVNRPGFMLSPTSCAPKQVVGTFTSVHGAVSRKSHRFQVGDCQALPFEPKLALSLTGKKQTTTGKHPGIKAKVTQTGIGEAGIERAVVRLPKSLALDPDNAQALCEFEDGTKPDLDNHCPKGSIVGRARARTPLLDDDLVGNVYFVKNVRVDKKTGNKIRTLPMIMVALRGEIAINLKGETNTTKNGKQLVNTFGNVPDAPVSQFNLNIKGGKNGILAVTRTRKSKLNLCTAKQTATVALDGHNGKQRNFNTRVKTPCAKKRKKRGKK